MGVSTAQAVDHSKWNRLLHQHVKPVDGGHASQVDYVGMRRDRAELERYLDELSGVRQRDFERLSAPAQLALLINAYNAWTVELILGADREPGSIRDLGTFLRSPWQKSFIPLLGEVRSLDDIEHELIRSGPYHEPRIHFALNCASIGCPALREEAYDGARLEQQLEDATRRFLGDRKRNRLSSGSLQISSLFRWYREDFAQRWALGHGLSGFLATYGDALGLDSEHRQRLANGDLLLTFLGYDWRLNRVP